MSNIAKHHKSLADAIEVQIEALGLVIHGLKRQRDAHRELEKFFSPAPAPLGSPLPVIAPPAGFDPDFDDPPPEQASPEPAR